MKESEHSIMFCTIQVHKSDLKVMKIFKKMKTLICKKLGFDKTEINRFYPNLGGVLLTQGNYLKN